VFPACLKRLLPWKKNQKSLRHVREVLQKKFIKEKEPEEFTPRPGSAAEKIYNLIPESEKVDSYDYKKLKEEALREKYDE